MVPGKEYTLQAELISKEDGETVLGKGSKTFTPKSADGQTTVEITVNDSVTTPVEAAVAFEELTSTEVDKSGKDTPNPEQPNKIAEHKDINDENQTVTSKKADDAPKHDSPEKSKQSQPKQPSGPKDAGSKPQPERSTSPGVTPKDAGKPLPSNAKRIDIKSIPSGPTTLAPGMPTFVG